RMTETSKLRVFDLKQVWFFHAAELADESGHPARAILGDLSGISIAGAFRRFFVNNPHFSEYFVEFRVVGWLIWLAEGGQEEIDAPGKDAAQIIDTHGSAMRERPGHVGRHDQHARLLAEAPAGADHERDRAAAESGFPGPKAQQLGLGKGLGDE